MSTDMVTQADEQAAIDFLRSCQSVPWELKDELAEAFARQRTAAQPEREAVSVTDEMVETALKARVPGGSEVWVWLPQEDAWTPHQTARDVMRCALEAALTTPAPAVSTEELERLLAHVREGGPHEWGYRDVTDGTFIADDWPFDAAAFLSRILGEVE